MALELEMTLGVGIILATLLFITTQLDNEHYIFKLIVYFFSIILITITPSIYIISTFPALLNKVVMGFVVLFWLYVGVYLAYYGIKKAGEYANQR